MMDNHSDIDNCASFRLSLQQGLSAFEYMAVGMETMIMFGICIGNGLVFAAFIRSHQMKDMTNYYIFQLAIADGCLGISMPLHIATFFEKQILLNDYICGFRYATLLISGSASTLVVVSLTYDRYVSIVNPLLYDNSLTKKRIVSTTIGIWVPGFAVNFMIPMFWHNPDYNSDCMECNFTNLVSIHYIRYIMLTTTLCVLMMVVAMYCRIFIIANKQLKKIQSEEHSIAWSRANPLKTNNSKNSSFRKQLKLVKTGFIVCSSFIGCWLPYFIILSIEVSMPGMMTDRMKTIRAGTVFLSIFNSAINPIIYTFRLPAFRREVEAMLCRRKNEVQELSWMSKAN